MQPLRRKFRSIFSSTTSIGLDIGSRFVKLVQLRHFSQGAHLIDVQIEGIPEEDERVEMQRSVGLGLTLKRLVEKRGIEGAKVAISISGPSVIVKPINVPWMTEEELQGHLELEIDRYLPYEGDDIYWDYYLPQSNHLIPGPTMTMYLVAAKRDVVDHRVQLVTQVGLVPVVVDLDSLALANMHMVNYKNSRDGSDLIVNVGPSGFSMITVGSTKGFYQYDAMFGGERQSEVSQGEMAREVTCEIQKAIEDCRSSDLNDSISRVLLSGGYACYPGFVESLSSQLSISVEVVNPFKGLIISKGVLAEDRLEETSVLAGVAVGLALRSGRD